MKNRKPFPLQVPTIALVYKPLAYEQFVLGMIEHYGDEITIQKGAGGKYVVRHAGIAIRRFTAVASARNFAAKFDPSPKESPRDHGVAPLGAKDLRDAGWRPLER